ncbi:methyl-accepting chemotaxis protein [Roseibium aggregatum]|uniref:GAF domain-containing protein n=1 Tax=Roseibium aggregatum TaxID=187304 RepID=A0A939E8T8_9HYPH|nr:methyl-accepting chemotaxis protein [Roseibium aggregatum]MBN9668986.1 GAF domain-containing protein [Roseibium aggregatum]
MDAERMLQRKSDSSQPATAIGFDTLFDLLERVERIGHQASGFHDWLRHFMKVVCDFTGWKLGHAWAPCADNPEELSSIKIWYIQQGVHVESFKAKTETLRFKSGIGLPGRVHEKKKCDWIFDVIEDDNYPRKPFAKEGGLKGGYGCPVFLMGEVAAVIEFYDDRPADPDPLLIRLLEYLGTQVAPVLERSRAAQRRSELAQDLETMFSRCVEDISDAAQRVRQIAETVSKLSDDARTNSRSSSEASAQSSHQVRDVSDATGEFLTTIDEIQGELAGTRSTVSTATDRIVAAKGTFESLKAGAQEIEGIVEIINKIAEKTKLLSLNATIEASRAGEMGAGFAVVASEVKELAAQTEQSTNDIAQRVHEIQAFATEALQEFEAISGTISRISDLTTTISSSMDAQQQRGQTISENANAADEQSQQASSTVKDVVRQLAEINDNASEVFQTACEFAERIQKLQGEVSGFVTEIRRS